MSTPKTKKPPKKLPKAKAEAAAAELPPWGEHSASERIEIAPTAVLPSPLNPRKHLDGGKVHELACLIRQHGFRGTLLARRLPSGAEELIWGHHRRAAAAMAGCPTIPVEIIEATDREVRRLQVAENRTRTDLHPLEEAAAFQALVDDGEKVEEIAAGLAVTVQLVKRRLKLQDLKGKALEAFEAGELSLGAAELLAGLGPDDQVEVLEYIRQRNPSIRELTGYIAQHITTDLGEAPWDLNDAQLVPSAGACSACPMRTGAQQDLGLFAGGEKGKDRCTNATCFETKREAQIDRAIAELERKEGEAVLGLCLDGGHGYYNEPKAEQARRKAALPYDKWRRVSSRERCASTKPAVITCGRTGYGAAPGLKVGDQLFVCTASKCKTHGETEEKEKKRKPDRWEVERKKAQAKAKAEAEKKRELVALVMDAATTRLNDSNGELDRAELLMVTKGFWRATHYEEKKRIAKRRGWPEGSPHDWPREGTDLTFPELVGLVFELGLLNDYRGDALKEAAKRLKVAPVESEKSTPKKPAPKGQKKRK